MVDLGKVALEMHPTRALHTETCQLSCSVVYLMLVLFGVSKSLHVSVLGDYRHQLQWRTTVYLDVDDVTTAVLENVWKHWRKCSVNR